MSESAERKALVEWIAASTGGEVERLSREVGGGTREIWFADVQRGEQRLELVVRRDSGGGPFSGTELSLAREAAVYRALEQTPIPVPRVFAECAGRDAPEIGDAILLERVRGSADFPALRAPTERVAVAEHFIEILATLHRLDPASVRLPALLPKTPEEHALLDLALWERLHREHVRSIDPLISFAIRWLRRRAPRAVQRTSILQGDTGAGNFLFEDGRVTAVLDWEFAHYGDPMDDLAWLMMRDHMYAFGDMSALFRSYQERSGIIVDPQRILYYWAFVSLRCAISTLVAVEAEGLRMGAGIYLSRCQVFFSLLCDCMAAHDGVDLEPTELPEPDTEVPRADLYDVLLADLEAVSVPVLADPPLARRARAMGDLLRFLQASERTPSIRAIELDELARLLGTRPTTPERGADQLAQRIEDEEPDAETGEALLRYFARRSDRQRWLWAEALGPLATRRAAPVPRP